MQQLAEPNLDNLALEKAQLAMSFIEQLESLTRDISAFKNYVDTAYQPEVTSFIERLKAILAIVSEDEIDLSLMTFKPLASKIPSKIERLGLAKQIVNAREGGMTLQQISDQYDISKATVSSFLKTYDAMKPVEKMRTQRASIFDTTNQMEELSAMIYRCLAKLEGNDNLSHVKMVGELRQLITAAHNVSKDIHERITTQQKIDILKNNVYEILADVLPEKRDDIRKRFAAMGMKGFLGAS